MELAALDQRIAAIEATPPPAAGTRPASPTVTEAMREKSGRVLFRIQSTMKRSYSEAVENSEFSDFKDRVDSDLNEQAAYLTGEDFTKYAQAVEEIIDDNDWSTDDEDFHTALNEIFGIIRDNAGRTVSGGLTKGQTNTIIESFKAFEDIFETADVDTHDQYLQHVTDDWNTVEQVQENHDPQVLADLKQKAETLRGEVKELEVLPQ